MRKRIFVVNRQISQEELKFWFYYRNGELFLRYDMKRRNQLANEPMRYIMCDGYRRYHINRKLYMAHRLIFLYHNGFIPEFIDHKDLNRQNNAIENLRVSTKSQNGANRNKKKNSSSVYLGVHKNLNHWEAATRKNKKPIWLGSHSTEESAALAYNRGAVFHHGEFANLNIIQPK